jgi:hypothetical protein
MHHENESHQLTVSRLDERDTHGRLSVQNESGPRAGYCRLPELFIATAGSAGRVHHMNGRQPATRQDTLNGPIFAKPEDRTQHLMTPNQSRDRTCHGTSIKTWPRLQ